MALLCHDICSDVLKKIGKLTFYECVDSDESLWVITLFTYV